MITKILHKPVSIAQHVVGGVARSGLHGAVAVVKRILPDDHTEQKPSDRTADGPTAGPTVTTEPVTQPPSPTTTTKRATTNTMPAKKASAKRAAAKKASPKKTAAKKPAAVLDEAPAPIDDDPVVYSTGPDVSTTVSAEDLRP